jgi:hypothetical protein
MPLYSRLTAAEKDQVLRELAQEIAFRNLRPASADLNSEIPDTLRTSERLERSEIKNV